MENKEQAYDETIKPLVDQLFERAKELGLPFILAIQVSDTDICGSVSVDEHADERLHVACIVMESGLNGLLSKLVVENVSVVNQVPVTAERRRTHD